MKIVVLKPCSTCSGEYSLNEFNNKEQAIEFIKNAAIDDLKHFKIYSVSELKIGLVAENRRNNK